MAEHHHDEKRVLPENMGGGPHGLGDPDDKSLRRVEREIVIPQKMKAIAKVEKCSAEVENFGKCAKDQGLMMPFMCRKLAKALEVCLTAAYKDPEFVDRCTKEYLEERTEYRKTGIKQKMKKKDVMV